MNEAPGRREPADATTVEPPMRDALVGAAFQLFLERGHEETTVDGIAALAGVGRRSFFRCLPSRRTWSSATTSAARPT